MGGGGIIPILRTNHGGQRAEYLYSKPHGVSGRTGTLPGARCQASALSLLKLWEK